MTDNQTAEQHWAGAVGAALAAEREAEDRAREAEAAARTREAVTFAARGPAWFEAFAAEVRAAAAAFAETAGVSLAVNRESRGAPAITVRRDADALVVVFDGDALKVSEKLGRRRATSYQDLAVAGEAIMPDPVEAARGIAAPFFARLGRY